MSWSSDLRDLHDDCYFLIEQDIAALEIARLARRARRRLWWVRWNDRSIIKQGEVKPVD